MAEHRLAQVGLRASTRRAFCLDAPEPEPAEPPKAPARPRARHKITDHGVYLYVDVRRARVVTATVARWATVPPKARCR
jgi:hypothetical protein